MGPHLLESYAQVAPLQPLGSGSVHVQGFGLRGTEEEGLDRGAVAGLHCLGRGPDTSQQRPLQSEPLVHHLEKDFESQTRKGNRLWLQDWLGATFSSVTELWHRPR